MASFDYNSRIFEFFCVLILIRAIVLCSPLGLQNLNLKRKTMDSENNVLISK